MINFIVNTHRYSVLAGKIQMAAAENGKINLNRVE